MVRSWSMVDPWEERKLDAAVDEMSENEWGALDFFQIQIAIPSTHLTFSLFFLWVARRCVCVYSIQLMSAMMISWYWTECVQVKERESQ